MRAAVYVRISNDAEGRELGVKRQETDCRALAEKLGYEVAHVYSENDVGASTRTRKRRPLYAEMIEAARSGAFTAIIAYSNSRLTRRPREFEDLIELYEKHGVRIHTCASGDQDLSRADGRAAARTIAAWDAAEAERTGERVQRAFLERAQKGERHGFVPYGWALVDGKDALDEDAAAVIRESAQRFLAGHSLRSVVIDLNARGVLSPRGKRWDSQMLRQLLLRERNAGRRIHQGKVFSRGDWPALLDEKTHDRVVARLSDPSRIPNRGAARRYLLSGIALCGKCGEKMRGNVGRKVASGGKKRQSPAYVCPACHGVRRSVERTDEVVEAAVLGRLHMPDAPTLFGGDPERLVTARALLADIQAKLDRNIDDRDAGLITTEQFVRSNTRLMGEEAHALAAVRNAEASGHLAEFAGDHVDAAWAAATIEVRQEVVRALMDVTILPTGAGGAFTPRSIGIVFKGADG